MDKETEMRGVDAIAVFISYKAVNFTIPKVGFLRIPMLSLGSYIKNLRKRGRKNVPSTDNLL